ncbi:MAG: hypothetical protein QM767_11375 [Anaeromyxobacter sp.]
MAYIGKGATRLLPLRAGSKLVVDASEAAVRSGQTDPRELLKFFRKGVDVFSQPRLHAKVFVFSKVAFVGSNNVSSHSANVLVEAAVALRTTAAVAQARRFVLDVAKSPMGEEFLKKLVKIYRPPRVPVAGRQRRRRGVTREELLAEAKPLRLIHLVPADWGESEFRADEAGRKIAEKRKTRGFKLDSFGWKRWAHDGLDEEIVMMVKRSPHHITLDPPGRVLAAKKVGRSNLSIVQIELPPKYKRKMGVVRKRLPRATLKRLQRSGRLAPKHAAAVRGLWA